MVVILKGCSAKQTRRMIYHAMKSMRVFYSAVDDANRFRSASGISTPMLAIGKSVTKCSNFFYSFLKAIGFAGSVQTDVRFDH